MHVSFSYDPRREVFPLLHGLGSRNNLAKTPIAREALAAGVDLAAPDAVASFIEAKIARDHLDIKSETQRIESIWQPVEQKAMRRLGDMFTTDFDPGLIDGYLTIGTRCPYNFSHRLFYVSALTRSPIQLCLHELLHFYTHQLIEPFFREAGVLERHNEFKEALTVLLNAEFSDLIEINDQGYPQHQELREHILNAWRSGKSVYTIAHETIREHEGLAHQLN